MRKTWIIVIAFKHKPSLNKGLHFIIGRDGKGIVVFYVSKSCNVKIKVKIQHFKQLHVQKYSQQATKVKVPIVQTNMFQCYIIMNYNISLTCKNAS